MNEEYQLEKDAPRAKPAYFIILVVVGLLAGLAAAEVYLRAVKPPLAHPVKDQISYQVRLGYVTFSPNSSFLRVNEQQETIRIDVDERGLRNSPGTLEGSNPILLGDSFIAAVNTANEKTVAGRLSATGIKAFNAGMDGSGTFQQFYLMRDILKDSGNRLVILAFYLGNDFMDNYWGNFLQDDTAANRYKDVELSVPLEPNHQGRLVAWLIRACSISVACDHAKSALDQALLNVSASDPMRSYALSEMIMIREMDKRAEIARKKTGIALHALSELVKERNGRLIVLGIPSKSQVLRSFKEISSFDRDPRARSFAEETFVQGYDWNRPDRDISVICADLGVSYSSLLERFRAAEVIGSPYYNFDVHWNGFGQKIAAELITTLLRDSLHHSSPQ
jgi:hypothetical protein